MMVLKLVGRIMSKKSNCCKRGMAQCSRMHAYHVFVRFLPPNSNSNSSLGFNLSIKKFPHLSVPRPVFSRRKSDIYIHDTQMASGTTGDPLVRYPSPDITFGIEYEFDFVVLKSLHHAFDPYSGQSESATSSSRSGSGLSGAEGDDEHRGADVGFVNGDSIVVVSETSLEEGSFDPPQEHQGDEDVTNYMDGIVYADYQDPMSNPGSSSHPDNEDNTGSAGNENETDENPESRFYFPPKYYQGDDMVDDPQDDPLMNEIVYTDNQDASDEAFGGYGYDVLEDHDDDDGFRIESIPSNSRIIPDDVKSEKTLRKEKRKQKKDSSDSGSGGPSEKTISTRLSEEHYQSINQYVTDLLNHALPHSPKTSSLIAPVEWAALDKEASPETWSVTQDGSVEPRRRAFALYQDLEAAEAAGVTVPERSERAQLRRGDRLERQVKKMWRVSGMDLVSAVLRYKDNWMPK